MSSLTGSRHDSIGDLRHERSHRGDCVGCTGWPIILNVVPWRRSRRDTAIESSGWSATMSLAVTRTTHPFVCCARQITSPEHVHDYRRTAADAGQLPDETPLVRRAAGPA